MKQFFLLGLIWLFASPVFALGGVGVGNGRTAYTAPVGLTVTYPSSLTLDVITDAKFQISNATFVKLPSHASRIVFDVSMGRVKDLGALKTMVAKDYPGKTFGSLEKPGAKGFYWESRTQDQLDGIYLLLTTNGDLVSITLSANAEGNGISLIEPIVSSFTYDNTPPLISKIYFENGVWLAGSRQKLFIKMTDDYSGVALTNSHLLWFEDGKGNVVDNVSSGAASPVKSEGGDLYSVEFSVNEFAQARKIILGSIVVSDNAGNTTQIWIDKVHPGHYSQGENRPLLPFAAAEIKSSLPTDTEPPKVLAIQVDQLAWNSGTTHVLHFHLDDNESGISEQSFFSQGMHLLVAKGQKTTYYMPPADLRAEGGGWYSLKMEISQYLPTGDYVFPQFYIEDRARNGVTIGIADNNDSVYHTLTNADGDVETKISIIKIHLTNVGGVDTTPPRILGFEPVGPWPAGSTQRFYFHATDDFSGFAKAMATPFFKPVDPTNQSPSIVGLRESVRYEGGDLYSVEIKLSPYLKADDYYLYFFELSDSAGNISHLNCGSTPTCVAEDGLTNLPRPILKVIR